MAKNRGRRIFKKEKVAEDWCFQCKDGGELMICDHGGCLKAYHPECVGVEDSVLTSDEPWICGRHACLVCKGKSYYQCYCCDRASCWSCIGEVDFVHLKGRNGLCNNCLKLALLLEEDRNIDSDGEIADFRDRETYECLFREYYELVKEKEGIDKNKLLAGKAQLDKEKISQNSSYSNKRCEKEDEQFSSGNENFNDGEPQKKKLKMKRCTQQKTKTQSKVIGSLEQNKLSSIWYSTAPKSQFAALIPENIKLVYLRQSLVMELIKQPESIKTKIIGSFVLVKLDPRRNSHQLVQITGTKLGSSDTCNSESSIQVSNVATDVSLTMLSDKDILEEHCDVLRKNVKAGLQKKLTIVELQQRAKILHEDITKHRIARELKVLQGKIDRANEKGWRQELTEHLNRRYLLQQDSYLSSVLENIPRVTPEEIEPVSLDRNDNQIVTPIKKNITGVTPEKIDSEPLAENDDGKLSSDNGDFSGEGPPKKGDEKKTYTQQKTKMQRRDTSQKKEFVGWGSKSLIDFLQFIGHDTREKLSPYDVTSMVIKYVNENDLIHPIEKRKILCDIQLEALLGRKVVNKGIVLSLLISHFVENEERLQKNELAHDLEDNDTEMFVASKTEKKVEQNKRSSIWYSTAAQSQFAALIPENIKLVYLKRSLVLEMIKKPESFETKIIGSFVRVKLDSSDFELRNSHQLVQITGIQPVSSDNCCCKSSIQVSNIAKNVCLNTLSDDEFSNEECDEFRKKVKDGIFKKLTVVELEQRAKILHEDITNHRIARELELALQNIPKVIPEEVESLDRDDNQMHLCSDEATLQKKIILE
ncbi:uncharacterized protein [Solanum lycopersicum]|uniref:uncharacterized protein isoform X4 n=1 Tax=Solanum lycopersicum TaxID=4081 RepID=UPI003748B6AC